MTSSTFDWVTGLFPKGGYFVEAGAHDGVGDSQTYRLEQLGTWTGVCVEPSLAFRGLKASRKCEVDDRVLFDGTAVIFREMQGNSVELSGIESCFGDHWDRESRGHRKDERPTVTLHALLREHAAPEVVEFLSLDTEGSELVILTAHDFDQFRFLAMQVEHNGVERQRQALRDLLGSRGYRLDGTDGINDRWLL